MHSYSYEETVDRQEEDSQRTDVSVQSLPTSTTGFVRCSEFELTLLFEEENVRHKVAVTPQTSIGELKALISSDLRLEQESLIFPTIQLDISVNEQTLASIHFPNSDNEKILRVCVRKRSDTDAASSITDHEANLNLKEEKKYLGGFRHVKTEQVFHHAATQTVPSNTRYGRRKSRVQHETQTQELITCSQQTFRESGTQIERTGLFLSSRNDRTIVPRSYLSSIQLRVIWMAAASLIQRFYRGYVARKTLQEKISRRKDHNESTLLRVVNSNDLQIRHHKRGMHRRMHPRTANDFEILYNELHRWRQNETMQLRSNATLKTESELRKEIEQLSEKETYLLRTIERLKMSAAHGNRKERIADMLKFMARSKRWQMSDGNVKEVETPFTIRAKELLHLYDALRVHHVPLNSRVEILKQVKQTVQEFECALSTELLALIDRETDLLTRGRSIQSLEGLRKRILNAFLRFIESPTSNPGAKLLQME